MDAHVELLATIWLLLLAHVALVLVIDKVDDGGPRVLVVDIVAKPRGVDDCKLDPELFLLEFGLDDIDLGVLVLELLCVSIGIVAGRCELGREQGVDQCRLAQPRLADDHDRKVSPSLCDDAMALIGQVGDPTARLDFSMSCFGLPSQCQLVATHIPALSGAGLVWVCVQWMVSQSHRSEFYTVLLLLTSWLLLR